MKTIHYIQLTITGAIAGAIAVVPYTPASVHPYCLGFAAFATAFLGALGVTTPSAIAKPPSAS
jgi:hypothetical protein